MASITQTMGTMIEPQRQRSDKRYVQMDSLYIGRPDAPMINIEEMDEDYLCGKKSGPGTA